ncbi:MAG: hypothetical protein KatS3mg064_0221 [Tepidiforma sp.]|jgi:hypothetical protein|nr:hypothetical protein [Tepidiforma sp.]GIW17064.1 MAG: hypothetical protein KatS3mg064_0221 [Tepidiforma sp.]
MKRRTLDIILSTGGLGIAILLVILGAVLSNQASWGRDYVKSQLGDQRITFATEDRLSDEEKTWKPGSTCLIKYAGQALVTGKQAECYANYYIAMHMRRSAASAAVDGNKMGWDNETYATMGPIVTDIRNRLNEARQAGNAAEAETLQKQLDAATSLRSTFQTGETLRGLLLTTYGFSVITDRVQVAAYIAYGIAAVMAILAAAGYVHAFRTPPDRVVLSNRDAER